MNYRPRVKLKHYDWKAADGSMTPGIGINKMGVTIAHYTPDEARALADKLHDLADHLDRATTAPAIRTSLVERVTANMRRQQSTTEAK